MTSIVFAAVLAVAAAVPKAPKDGRAASPEPEIRIVSQIFLMDPHGNYLYGYEQSNGQMVREVGRVVPGPEPGTGSVTQQGEFQLVGEDGQTYHVSYIANENGFQPQAEHLPRPPAQLPEYQQLRNEYPELFHAEDRSL